MTVARLIDLAKKAATRPPREVLARIGEEARRAARRPWSHIYPVIFTERALVGAAQAESVDALWSDLARAPFFLTPADRESWTAAFRMRYPRAPEEIVAAAERVLGHEFDLLGSGPKCLGPRLPWHEDFKTGRVWPLAYSPDIEYSELDRPTDVKVPWELSRCQHVPLLGQAYWLTGDERYAREYVDEIEDWISNNPWGRGVNWACAMDVALRAVSWIWGFYFFAGSAACADASFRSRLLRSLYLHGEYVATHLEKGPVNGNHYLSDGVGLVFLGILFRRTARGRQWLDTGRAIVLEEILLQVEDDGVDFEASTAYHRLVLELFLSAYQLLRLHGETIPAAQWHRIERMFEFVEAYSKPDGRAPLIGDADDGRVQILGRQPIGDHRYLLSTGAALFARADFKAGATGFWEESFWLLGPDHAAAFDALVPASAAPVSKAFPAGGFFVLRDRRTHLVMDCGNVGMRGIGGHGHNDSLSFELVLDGLPIVTDCGAYLYTASRDWRNAFRSTAFHNTIHIDGEEINRFISPDNLWQLHDDAAPDGVTWSFGARQDDLTVSHRGYLRLAQPVKPVRRVVLARDQGLVWITDTLEGLGRHDVVWRFHLEPGLACEITDSGVRFARDGEERWLLPVDGFDELRIGLDTGWVSPSYGVKHETRVVTVAGRITVPHRVSYLLSTRHVTQDERAQRVHALTNN